MKTIKFKASNMLQVTSEAEQKKRVVHELPLEALSFGAKPGEKIVPSPALDAVRQAFICQDGVVLIFHAKLRGGGLEMRVITVVKEGGPAWVEPLMAVVPPSDVPTEFMSQALTRRDLAEHVK